jgi:hypothetical protein
MVTTQKDAEQWAIRSQALRAGVARRRLPMRAVQRLNGSGPPRLRGGLRYSLAPRSERAGNQVLLR